LEGRKKAPAFPPLPVTFRVVRAVAVLTAFLAVNTYSVVAAGRTTTLDPLTAPRPGLIERLVAPLTLQERVLAPPEATVDGLALKLAITGAPALPADTTNGSSTV
jgi:hypothetical protein